MLNKKGTDFFVYVAGMLRYKFKFKSTLFAVRTFDTYWLIQNKVVQKKLQLLTVYTLHVCSDVLYNPPPSP